MEIETKIQKSSIVTTISKNNIPVEIAQHDVTLKPKIDNVISMIDVDQKYNPESQNAQSGKAVNEAIQKVKEENSSNVKYIDQNLTEEEKKVARNNISSSSNQHIHYCIPKGTIIQPDITLFQQVKSINSIDKIEEGRLSSEYDLNNRRITLNMTQDQIFTKIIPAVTEVSGEFTSDILFSGEKTIISEPIEEVKDDTEIKPQSVKAIKNTLNFANKIPKKAKENNKNLRNKNKNSFKVVTLKET